MFGWISSIAQNRTKRKSLINLCRWRILLMPWYYGNFYHPLLNQEWPLSRPPTDIPMVNTDMISYLISDLNFLYLELYLNGIQRGSFIPCIELIKSSLEVINLCSETDYRTKSKQTADLYRFINPINDQTSKKFMSLINESCPNSKPLELQVMGRPLLIPQGKLGTCAKFSFQNLFVEPKSAADYIEITKCFKTIFVQTIPEFTIEMRNEIRRFITFIDQVYEHKVSKWIEVRFNRSCRMSYFCSHKEILWRTWKFWRSN